MKTKLTSKSILVLTLTLYFASGMFAQVKIGHEAEKPVNKAALLELSNDLKAEPNTWRGLVLPYVDFSNVKAFENHTSWGIAGLPMEGTIVYNIGNRTDEGFEGPGAYVWTGGGWVAAARPPKPFNFSNCSNPNVNGTFVVGTPTTATVTLHYNNGNGSSYPAYNSPTVNGIILSTPAGQMNNNSGNLTFTASGTPVFSGNFTIPVSIAGSHTCHVAITVQPAPTPLQFINCDNPVVSGNLVAGISSTASVMLYFANSPGGSYPAYTSPTVNGITLTTPAGTLPVGSGMLFFTASGTPGTSGFTSIPITYAGSWPCTVVLPVHNAPPVPPPGGCVDPGPEVGSTGCVTFTYRGQQVTYQTVRANDGKIWLQQNVGSPQVAYFLDDHNSFGHYFQWGRWDDGHQLPASVTVTGGESLRNPSHIPSGNPNFIKGSTTATSWWGLGGMITDTWTGTVPTATNGIDPATALGAGWHTPTAAEWTTVVDYENIFDSQTAFDSRLKLTISGYRRNTDGGLFPDFVGGYYWSRDAANANVAKNLFFDEVYNALVTQTDRGYGFPLRFVKN